MSKHSNPTEQAISGKDYTAVLLRFAKAKARLRCNLHASRLGTTINFNKSPF